MNIMNLFRKQPEPTPIEEPAIAESGAQPKKTPIPGAPVLPEGYYYSVRVKPGEEWRKDIEFYLWVYVYRADKRLRPVERVGSAVDFHYTQKSQAGSFGAWDDADLTATAIKAYQNAFPSVRVLDIPESISDYIGDHHA